MRILTAYDKVKNLLERRVKYRNSYYKLLAQYWYEELGANELVNRMTALDLLQKISRGEITHPESIMRARRKVQEEHPELSGNRKKRKEENVKKELGY
jgi:hypothetical protein